MLVGAQRLPGRWRDDVVDPLEEPGPSHGRHRAGPCRTMLSTNRLTAWIAVTWRRSSSRPMPTPATVTSPTAPVVAARAVRALGRCRSIADLASLVEQRAHRARIAVVAHREDQRRGLALERGRGRVGDPAVRVDDVDAAQLVDQRAQSGDEARIRERWQELPVGVRRSTRDCGRQRRQAVQRHAIDDGRLGLTSLANGRHGHAVAASGQCRCEQLDLSLGAADGRVEEVRRQEHATRHDRRSPLAVYGACLRRPLLHEGHGAAGLGVAAAARPVTSTCVSR